MTESADRNDNTQSAVGPGAEAAPGPATPARSGVPVVALRNLSKSFGGTHALDDVDLTILPGRGPRPPRRERLGQVDADQDPRRLPRPRRRRARGQRRSRHAAAASRAVPRARPELRAPGPRARRVAHRAREPPRRRAIASRGAFGSRGARSAPGARDLRPLRRRPRSARDRRRPHPAERALLAIVRAVEEIRETPASAETSAAC